MNAKSDNANRDYYLLGSVTGTGPTPLPGGYNSIPLTWDAFTNIVVSMINDPFFMGFKGTLNYHGIGKASMNAAMSWPHSAVGLNLYFAYALNNPWDFASNPVIIEIVP